MKKIVFLALISGIFMVGCCQKCENRDEQPPVAPQDRDNDNGLNWYANPANPVGLFSGSWSPN